MQMKILTSSSLINPYSITATSKKLVHIEHKDFRSIKLPTLFSVTEAGPGLKSALDKLNQHVVNAINEGYNIIILSDRGTEKYDAPIPSLLAAASVHHHLIRKNYEPRWILSPKPVTQETLCIWHYSLDTVLMPSPIRCP